MKQRSSFVLGLVLGVVLLVVGWAVIASLVADDHQVGVASSADALVESAGGREDSLVLVPPPRPSSNSEGGRNGAGSEGERVSRDSSLDPTGLTSKGDDSDEQESLAEISFRQEISSGATIPHWGARRFFERGRVTYGKILKKIERAAQERDLLEDGVSFQVEAVLEEHQGLVEELVCSVEVLDDLLAAEASVLATGRSYIEVPSADVQGADALGDYVAAKDDDALRIVTFCGDGVMRSIVISMPEVPHLEPQFQLCYDAADRLEAAIRDTIGL